MQHNTFLRLLSGKAYCGTRIINAPRLFQFSKFPYIAQSTGDNGTQEIVYTVPTCAFNFVSHLKLWDSQGAKYIACKSTSMKDPKSTASVFCILKSHHVLLPRYLYTYLIISPPTNRDI